MYDQVKDSMTGKRHRTKNFNDLKGQLLISPSQIIVFYEIISQFDKKK